MAMIDLGEYSIFGSGVSVPLATLQSPGHIKIMISGELSAHGKDRRLLVRLNSKDAGYSGCVSIGGSHNLPREWETSGFYLGHNGWGLDASCVAEYTLSFRPGSTGIVGSGMSTFAHRDGRILGYRCHCSFTGQIAVQRLEIGFNGGTVTGAVRILQF